MKQFIQIYWTTSGLEEARSVARRLVQDKLVACANIIPRIESIFMWNNQLDTIQETKVIFKTVDEKFDEVKKIIIESTKYEIPEILKVPILGGHKEYLDWIEHCTTSIAN